METRARIAQAAADCLAYDGLSATTTSAVARLAGVSQGAVFRHFPAKSLLLGAALSYVLDHLFERYVDLSAAPETELDPDPIRDGLAVLWALYTTPALYGAFELFLAARTDAELRDVIAPIMTTHAQRELELARMLFPVEAGTHPDFDGLITGLLSTLQGAAVAAGALGPIADPPVELMFVERIVRAELGSPLAPVRTGDE